MKPLLVTTQLLVAATACAAQPAAKPVHAQYIATADYAVTLCGFAQLRANASGNSADGATSCIREQLADLQRHYAAARKAARSPGLKSALAQHYAAAAAALQGLPPAPAERSFQYDARQTALRGRLTQAAALVEAEAVP